MGKKQVANNLDKQQTGGDPTKTPIQKAFVISDNSKAIVKDNLDSFSSNEMKKLNKKSPVHNINNKTRSNYHPNVGSPNQTSQIPKTTIQQGIVNVPQQATQAKSTSQVGQNSQQ